MIAINDMPQLIHANAMLVTTAVGTLIPILVGLATKSTNKYKGLAVLVLNGISAAIVKATLPDGGATFTAQTAMAAVFGIVASLATYEHLWKKVGLTNNADHHPKALLGPGTGI